MTNAARSAAGGATPGAVSGRVSDPLTGGRIEGARVTADGAVEKLELMPPDNFWMMCPWGGEDYSYAHDAFALPAQPPLQVQLGANCRAIVLSWMLRPDAVLQDVTLETLSQDVVIGLMGLSLETA